MLTFHLTCVSVWLRLTIDEFVQLGLGSGPMIEQDHTSLAHDAY